MPRSPLPLQDPRTWWSRLHVGTGINYSDWNVDGYQTMGGLGRPWRDALGELQGAKKIGVRIADNLTEGTVTFADTCIITTDWVALSFQFNHDRDESAEVSPHLHWFQASANVPNWMIEYRWQVLGGAKTTGWTRLKCNTTIFTYTTGTIHQLCESADITPPTGSKISDILQMRLTRDTNNASGLFTGVDPLTGNASALMLDIHIQMNALGSAEEYSKVKT